jgi:putative phosphoesterase
MKIALIGDIHANLPAFEAVLSQIKAKEVDRTWNIGDTVGYGPFPDESVKRLRQENILSIRGNYDSKVLKFKRKNIKWRKTKRYEKWLAFKWAYENLSEESRRYLKDLPKEYRMEIEGKNVLLTHGSPTSSEEHLTPKTPLARFRMLAQTANADLVVFGHSHIPFGLQVKGVWFINPGSVGRQDDGDPRASYAILHLRQTALEVHHFRVEYDIESTITAIREQNLPEAFAQMMIVGRKLDDILDFRNDF